MKLTRTQRLIRIVQKLQAGRRCGINTLAEEMAVSRRTIFRDLSVLSESGIGCTYDPDSGNYRIDRSYYLRPVNMTLEEALAIMLLTRSIANERIMPSAAAAISAGLKIESIMPAEIRKSCGALLDGVDVAWPASSDVDAVSDVLFRCQRATADKQKIRIAYDSYYDKAEIETVLHPHQVIFKSRGWYVIGYSEKHREVRMFKLDRVVSLTLMEDRFKPDLAFNVKDYFGNAWNVIRGDQRYHVEVHFSSQVAGNVEEVTWHSTQRTRRRSDGSLVFEVDVDGIEEISWWIMGYGDQAIVQEPDILRVLIASHAQRLVRHYENNDSTPMPRS